MLLLRIWNYRLFKAFLCWNFSSPLKPTRFEIPQGHIQKFRSQGDYLLGYSVHSKSRGNVWYMYCKLPSGIPKYALDHEKAPPQGNLWKKLSKAIRNWAFVVKKYYGFSRKLHHLDKLNLWKLAYNLTAFTEFSKFCPCNFSMYSTLLLSGRHHPMVPTLGRAAATSEREKALCTETQLVTHYGSPLIFLHPDRYKHPPPPIHPQKIALHFPSLCLHMYVCTVKKWQ